MITNSFDWEGDSVVLGYQPMTAVLETSEGGIEILHAEDGQKVTLTPMGAVILAWRLIEVAHKIGLPKPPRDLMVAVDMGPSSPLPEAAVV